MQVAISLYCLLAVISLLHADKEEEETDDPRKRQPSKCEVCKYLVTELKTRLDETGKNREILRLGHGLDEEKKRKVSYKTSELRLTEALTEPHICNRILEYNVHAERKGSLRYAKGRSETMETLHGLVNKGVKVELGIPYELWDEPSAEVSIMQRSCFKMVEDYEDDIEDWYYNQQELDLMTYLCQDRVLSKNDQKCLKEIYTKSEDKEDDDNDKKANKKGDDGRDIRRKKKETKSNTSTEKDDTKDTSKSEKTKENLSTQKTDTEENFSKKDEL